MDLQVPKYIKKYSILREERMTLASTSQLLLIWKNFSIYDGLYVNDFAA